MTHLDHNFEIRDAAEQTWLTENTWCDTCGDAEVGLLNPRQYREGNRVYIEGECRKCGHMIRSEIFEASTSQNASRSYKQHLLVDGCERAIKGIEAEIRAKVEQKYAVEWNSSGLLKRWFMLRRIEREISERVAERLRRISPDSLF